MQTLKLLQTDLILVAVAVTVGNCLVTLYRKLEPDPGPGVRLMAAGEGETGEQGKDRDE